MSDNTPPPWEDITGISRTVMKDNAQESILNYNGNARPAEFVVNQTTSNVYIGNSTGNLTLVWSPAVALAPVYSSAQVANISGTIGQYVAISNSPTNAGRLAYWDGTNNRWSYIDTNAAV